MACAKGTAMMTNQRAIQGLLSIAEACQNFENAGTRGRAKVWREAVFFFWEDWRIAKFSRNRIHSTKAAKLINGDKRDRCDGCTYDHAVPFAHLQRNEYFSEISENNIHQYLKYIVGVIVTKDENSALNQHGLAQKMPKNWDSWNLFARYECAGIELIFPESWQENYGLSYLEQYGEQTND